MRARSFFYVSLGILALTVACVAAARQAIAQLQTSIPTEVAVLRGVASDGETIPLPTYRDGSLASESECQWLVSMNEVLDGTTSSGTLVCYAEGRVVRVANTGYSVAGRANYLIIAVRSTSGPTVARQETLGQLKARYR